MPCHAQKSKVVFGSRDIREEYGGKGLERATSKVRRCSATFSQPLRKPSGSSCVGAVKSTGACGGAVSIIGKADKVESGGGGEKVKVPINRVSDGSASSGSGSASDNSEREVSVDGSLDLPPSKLGRLCEILGKSRGPDTCTYCGGVCCGSMRDLINVLVGYKEAEPNQKV